MNKLLTTSAIIALSATSAIAGGLDRSGQSISIIYQDGDYAELSFGSVSPSVSGVATGAFIAGPESGNMSPSYTQVGGGFKTQINDDLAFALVFDQPYGGDVEYPTGTSYFAEGATASVDSTALTAVLKYNINERVSIHAGLRHQSIQSEVSIPAQGYDLATDTTTGTGYLLGAAYEIPDIALRVALTYNSSIEHSQNTSEAGGLLNTVTEFESPQSINLEFQSGVATDTLVFGSIRWVEWSSFNFAPAGFLTATGDSLLSYDDDTITYNLGVGRRLNDNWSIAASIGYEAGTGGFSGNLGPTDGSTSLGLGATYTKDNMEITGGVRYVWVGDASVEHPSPLLPGTEGASFEGNSALGVGIKVGFNF